MSKVRKSKILVISILISVVLILILLCLFAYGISNLTLTSISVEAPEHLELSEKGSITIYTYYENNSIFSDNVASIFKKIKKRFLDVSVVKTNDCINMSSDVYFENNKIIYEIVGISDGECNIDIGIENIQKSIKIVSGMCAPQRVEATERIFVDVNGKTSQKIIPEVYPTYADNTVYFEIEDNSIANVDEEGNVLGKKSGETIVYSKTPNGCIAETHVICAKFAEQFKLNSSEMSQRRGTKFTIGYKIVPNDVTYYSDVIWNVEDENIVKQTNSGVFEAVNPGTTKIIAKFTSSTQFQATCIVTVF